IVISYAAIGIVLSFMFAWLSPAAEAPAARKDMASAPPHARKRRIYDMLGLPRSGRVVLKLSALFSLDAFAGAFILQSIVAYWFHLRYGVQPAALGAIFFGGNILAGISALSASWLARRIGLINTMVFTHIPSNILLILVPL